MSTVIAAVFADHNQASDVQTRFICDGFPTDRTHLSSREALGHAARIADPSDSAELEQYFFQLFSRRRTAQELTRAVVAGRAVIVVCPRGEHEISRTFELFRRFGPLNLRHRGLENQFIEHSFAASLLRQND